MLAGCAWHTLRRRCANGPVMAAHSLGRIERARQARRDRVRGDHADDFLSGESGTVGGRRDVLRELDDRAMALRGLWQLVRARAAARGLRRRVLVLSVVREENRAIWERAIADLRRSSCELVVLEREPGGRERFANLNLLLASATLESFDWVLLLDDDVELPARFLDPFLYLAERCGLSLAAPAHRMRSHAAWRLTRRQWGSVVRETAFVEIGPVTALHRDTFATLLPFPEVGMGWGLDAHWSWLAREHGWRIGLVDLLPVAHLAAPAASGYGREAAVAAARAFLAEHPYLPVRRVAADARGAPPMRVAVVAEFYPRRHDPVLGVWAHRQALAARDAGADVSVFVLHRLVPPRRDPGALWALVRQPARAQLDGLEVRYVRYVSPPRSRALRALGPLRRAGAAARAARRALRRGARPQRGPGRRCRAAGRARSAARGLDPRRRRALDELAGAGRARGGRARAGRRAPRARQQRAASSCSLASTAPATRASCTWAPTSPPRRGRRRPSR